MLINIYNSDKILEHILFALDDDININFFNILLSIDLLYSNIGSRVQ